MTLAAIRAILRALPHSTWKKTWGEDDVFYVGSKMFAVLDGESAEAVAFKTVGEAFEDLTARDGIIPAPYLDRARWVKVEDLAVLTPAEWRSLLVASHAFVWSKLTKRERSALSTGAPAA